MCDLCIRYTSLVDRYVPNLAACMRDQSELVRRQTLLLLTRLLQVPDLSKGFFPAIVTAGRSSYQCSGQSRVQEDYVKWKGPLFYRFVVALVDESPAVRQFGASSSPPPNPFYCPRRCSR
jgi:condensin-2 complex subunit D3